MTDPAPRSGSDLGARAPKRALVDALSICCIGPSNLSRQDNGMSADRCPGPDACVWSNLCAPGRCIVEETIDSPNYARFAPCAESIGQVKNRRAALWPGWRALFCDLLPPFLASLMLWIGLYCVVRALGRFWGVF